MCCKGNDCKDDCGIVTVEPHWRTQRDQLYYKLVHHLEKFSRGSLEYEINREELLREHEHIENIIHAGKERARWQEK